MYDVRCIMYHVPCTMYPVSCMPSILPEAPLPGQSPRMMIFVSGCVRQTGIAKTNGKYSIHTRLSAPYGDRLRQQHVRTCVDTCPLCTYGPYSAGPSTLPFSHSHRTRLRVMHYSAIQSQRQSGLMMEIPLMALVQNSTGPAVAFLVGSECILVALLCSHPRIALTGRISNIGLDDLIALADLPFNGQGRSAQRPERESLGKERWEHRGVAIRMEEEHQCSRKAPLNRSTVPPCNHSTFQPCKTMQPSTIHPPGRRTTATSAI